MDARKGGDRRWFSPGHRTPPHPNQRTSGHLYQALLAFTGPGPRMGKVLRWVGQPLQSRPLPGVSRAPLVKLAVPRELSGWLEPGEPSDGPASALSQPQVHSRCQRGTSPFYSESGSPRRYWGPGEHRGDHS